MSDPPENNAPQAWLRYFWVGVLLAAAIWYAHFRVAQPLRCEPFSTGLHGNDFKHLYIGAWMLPRGLDPYDATELSRIARLRGFDTVNPYVYLPFTGLVLSPLALLDPPTALRAWFLLSHALLLASLGLLFYSLSLRPTARNLAVALGLAALCYPLHRTLSAGQLNCALLFFYALVFALERRGWFLAAGAAAAFAFLFKLTPGILLVYFLWRAWTERKRATGWAANGPLRAALAICLASAVLLGACVAWVGPERHAAFRPLLSQMGYGKSTWAERGERFYRAPGNQSFNALFHRGFAKADDAEPWTDLGPRTANNLTRGALLLCLAIAALRLRGRADREMLYGVAILIALLAPSIYWDHYALLALWPLLACYARLPDSARGAAFLLFLAIALPLGSFLERPMWLMASFDVAALGISVFLAIRHGKAAAAPIAWALAGALLEARFPYTWPALRSGAGLLAMSLGLWGTLILLALCLAMARKTD